MFWLDVAEPGYATYDFDNYRYYLGTDLKVGNLYPNEFSKMVFDGLKEENNISKFLIKYAVQEAKNMKNARYGQ